MSPRRLRHLVILAIVSCSVACDQATKEIAISELKGRPPIEMGPARLAYTENPGAFLGLGGTWPDEVRVGIFLLASAALTLAFAYWLLREERPWPMVIGGALFVGGAMGNLIDRAFRAGGRVVDFAQIDFGFASTGVFNVADVILMAVIPIFLIWGRELEEKKDAPPDPAPA